MNRKQILKTVILVFLMITKIAYTQSDECNENFKKSLHYLKTKIFQQDSLKAVSLLEDCANKGDDKSQLLLARLYREKKDEKYYKRAFKLLKKSAKKGNTIAMADLGVMYKYGHGCNLNINKAKIWFERASNMGNDKATYSLGYIYLKGLGAIKQDYSKAVDFFSKSNYPMAKYWLGVCYYYGYGVEKNYKKSAKLLGVETKKMQKNIFLDLKGTKDSKEPLLLASTEIVKNEVETNGEILNKLVGKWNGALLKMDWSAKSIEQRIPLSLKIRYSKSHANFTYELSINNTINKGSFNLIDDNIYFDNLDLVIPHNSFHNKMFSKLNYKILTGKLAFKDLENTNYLSLDLDSYIKKFNEEGAPLKLILTKDNHLNDEHEEELVKQKESKIKIYPNPFENDLTISYNLSESSDVTLKILSIDGVINKYLEKNKRKSLGLHNYFFDAQSLKSGVYIVVFNINGKKESKLIIKK